MSDRNANQSWNPLNYSQNLCVVSNASHVSIAGNTTCDHFLDSFAALDIQREANDGRNRLVTDLMTANDKELRFDAMAGHRDAIGDNGLNFGDFALNVGHNRMNGTTLSAHSLIGVNTVNTNQSLPDINSLPFKSNVMSMSSHSFADMNSYLQPIRPMSTSAQQMQNQLCRPSGLSTDMLKNALINPSFNNKLLKTLPKPMANSLNTSLSSAMNQMNANQSLMPSMIGCKAQPLAYNQNQSYQQLAPLMDSSAQEVSYSGSRPMRSIRARSESNGCNGPTNKLNYYLDITYSQFRHLEKERKKIESELIDAFVGKKISSANNFPIQRLPQNASKIDKMITDMSREHAKVVTIVATMEQLKDREFSEDIHNCVQKWVDIIRVLQMKRKVEMQRNAVNGSVDDMSTDEMLIFYDL
ncbi:unnamed protein product [Oppiella nova]|uniref:Uncharacterized protein n=1 Tax=Oppiella nova TaxID=334625 RepID=A0A7R9QK15_9ACAR|nr:unnamed protein product [Oppiella nova]CAG2167251.1 unnamed protein product [Oppiella nova]